MLKWLFDKKVTVRPMKSNLASLPPPPRHPELPRTPKISCAEMDEARTLPVKGYEDEQHPIPTVPTPSKYGVNHNNMGAFF